MIVVWVVVPGQRWGMVVGWVGEGAGGGAMSPSTRVCAREAVVVVKVVEQVRETPRAHLESR